MDRKGSDNLFAHLLLIFFLSRLVLEGIGLLSLFYFPSARSLFPMRDLLYHEKLSPAAEIWARWDSEWYLLVADHGYNSFDQFKDYGGGRYRPSDIAKFFPLYPWTIRAANVVLGNSALSGILISNLSAVLFLFYFYQLGCRLFDGETSMRASLFYVFFPTSFFLNAVYSEALFLACITAAFYYVEKSKLFPAVLASGLAVLSRPTGILVAPALLWLATRNFGDRKSRAVIVMALVCLLSFGIYLVQIRAAFGNLEVVTGSQNYWRGEMRYPFYAFVRFFSNPVAIHGQHNSIIDFSFAIFQLVALVLSIRFLPAPYYIYSTICIVVPLSSSLFSFSRLCLVNFPFFLFLGRQLSGRWAFVLQTLFAMLLAFFMAAFANWYWVG
jgi:4-amino-4-deoxy-L-arabinose transferase-like glycosyltransferase